MPIDFTQEKKTLKFSIYGAFAFAVFAIVWGLFNHSQLILFDGIYSFVSVGLSYAALQSAMFIKQANEEEFPFGKEMLEPLIIFFKNLIIIILCLYAFITSFQTLVSGGQEFDQSAAVFYAFLASLGCYLVYRRLIQKNKTLKSGFITAESVQWLMDFYLSLAVLAGFTVSWILEFTPFKEYVKYVDSLMVMGISLYFIKLPFKLVRYQIREMLEMAPDKELYEFTKNAVASLCSKYPIEESVIRVSKVGSKLFIEVDFIVLPEKWEPTLKEQDEIREQLVIELKPLHLKKWITVSFMNDKKWALAYD